MRVLICVFCWLLVGSAAYAQVVTVRTGEHARFTRVVVSIPAGTDWRFGRSPSGYTLRLPDIERYALDDFFTRIPRTRIETATQNGGDLELGIDCLCSARAYIFRRNFLVIDVSDGPAPSMSSFELPLDPLEAGTTSATMPQRDAASGSGIAPERLVPLFVVPDRPTVPATAASLQSTQIRPAPIIRSPGRQGYVTNVSEEVAMAMGVAMSMGFLEGEITPAQEGAHARESIISSQNADALAIPGIDTRTGTDPATGFQGSIQPQTQSGTACLPDMLFAIEEWGDDRPFHVQLAKARQGLFGEFDEPDPVAVVTLAKVFLYFGFGREAIQSLALDQMESQERIYLRTIAQIIDGEVGQTDRLANQISCPAKVGMWAMLAAGDQPLEGEIDRLAVLHAFKSLPPHFRPVVGPRLARVFLRVNDGDAANQVLDRAISEGLEPIAAALGTSGLAAASGDVNGAFDLVNDAISSGADVTPEAMTTFFELGIEIGTRFDPGDFELADAIRFQSDGSEASNRLLGAQFLAHLAQDEFAQAERLFAQEVDRLSRDSRKSMNAALQARAVERMRDAAFGRLVWDESFRPANGEIQQNIALRLESMGFAARATEIRNLDLGGTGLPAGGMNDNATGNNGTTVAPEEAANAVPALNTRSVGTTAASTGDTGAPRNPASDLVDPQTTLLPSKTPIATGNRVAPSLAGALSLLESAATSRETIEDTLRSLSVDNALLPEAVANDP